MSYFVLLYNPETASSQPLVNPDMSVAAFATVLEAEEAALNPVAGNAKIKVSVYDFAKFEKPVPLVAPGTPILVNGQWVVSQ